MPALVGVRFQERRVHWMQCFRRTQPFSGGDLMSVVHQGQVEAGEHSSAVHVHGTRAALPMVAALSGSCERNRFSEAIKQRCSRIKSELVVLTVDVERDRDRALNGRTIRMYTCTLVCGPDCSIRRRVGRDHTSSYRTAGAYEKVAAIRIWQLR